MSLARSPASPPVKLPEITAVPPNEVNAWSDGWIWGADCTRPSRTMATCLWNCCCASASHWLLPLSVRFIFTVQPCPEMNSDFAELTAFPVRPAFPR